MHNSIIFCTFATKLDKRRKNPQGHGPKRDIILTSKQTFMRRHIIYALCLVVLAGGFSACKKVVSKSVDNKKTIVYKDGTTVEKTYKVTPGEPKPDQPKAPKPKKAKKPMKIREQKPKLFCAFHAKQLLRDQLQKEQEERYTAPVRIGYYECNSYNERLNLYKLAANKIINLKCDEIVTPNGPTYWVTVDLTWRGWWLKESPDKKLFPEDRIDKEAAKAFLNPKWDQDQWGIPTTDTIVPAPIKEAVKTFYRGLQAGLSYNQSLVDAKMVCAMSLLNTLASYGVDKLGVNPFTRDVALTSEMVENLTVLRMPRMQDAYVVTIGENSYLYVIELNENPTIVDLAYIEPKELKSLNQTVCSLAGKLTKEDIIRAREEKRRRDEIEARMREAMARQEQQVKPEDDFEMCATSGSLRMVEHSDPTLYELAKKAEHFEDVQLLAAVMKVTNLDELKRFGNKKIAYATAKATYSYTRVTAVGRIYLGMKEGESGTEDVSFIYTKKDGWQIGTPDEEFKQRCMPPCPKPCCHEQAEEAHAHVPSAPAQEEAPAYIPNHDGDDAAALGLLGAMFAAFGGDDFED